MFVFVCVSVCFHVRYSGLWDRYGGIDYFDYGIATLSGVSAQLQAALPQTSSGVSAELKLNWCAGLASRASRGSYATSRLSRKVAITTKHKCLICGVPANFTASWHSKRRFRNFTASCQNFSGLYASISLIGIPSGVPHMNVVLKHSGGFWDWLCVSE